MSDSKITFTIEENAIVGDVLMSLQFMKDLITSTQDQREFEDVGDIVEELEDFSMVVKPRWEENGTTWFASSYCGRSIGFTETYCYGPDGLILSSEGM